MSIKDALAIVLSAARDEPAILGLEKIAAAHSARASAVLVGILPDAIVNADGYLSAEVYGQMLADAEEHVKLEKQELAARLARASEPVALREVESPFGLLKTYVAVQARHADISIMTRPGREPEDEARRVIFEGVLFGSGRPVLLVPPGWKPSAIGENIVVAWNGRREAARALSDADSLIDLAKRVTIVTVDAKPGVDSFGSAPGADITAHLARRGVNVELRNVDGLGRGDAATILDECRSIGADLLVMGGYGSSRFQEMVFGGVTRELSVCAPLPVLMSH